MLDFVLKSIDDKNKLEFVDVAENFCVWFKWIMNLI